MGSKRTSAASSSSAWCPIVVSKCDQLAAGADLAAQLELGIYDQARPGAEIVVSVRS